MKWIEVGTLEDISPLGSRVIKTDNSDIAIFRTAEDKLFALNDRCPHKGGPLSQGIVHDERVTCPLHNWVISLESGQATGPDEGCTNTYPIKLENNVIFIGVKEPSLQINTDDCQQLAEA